MRRSAVEKAATEKGNAAAQVLDSVEDLMAMLIDDNPVKWKRKLLPTQLAYMQSRDRLKAYMGPAGCAKTTTGCADIMLRALLIPGTKWFIARRDYNDLKKTTMDTMVNILNRLPDGTLVERSKAPPESWHIRPIMTAGQAARSQLSEITFIGLSDNVGSYQFTGGFIDEADEVEQNYFEQMKMRLRARPAGVSADQFDECNHFIGLAFNPPPKAHWLYKACTGMNELDEVVDEPKMTLFKPQPRENAVNLSKGYYDELGATMPEELRLRLVEGQWGAIFPGEPVIRQFKRHVHVKKGMEHRHRATLYRFWDFGFRRPGVLWAQVRKDGHIQVLREFMGKNVEGAAFVSQVLAQTAEHFPDAESFADIGDPAVKQQKDTGSMLTILSQAGVSLKSTRTPLDLSLDVLRKRFETMTEGEPALLIDERCRILADALSGGYHMDPNGLKPIKDNEYDHLVDCLRYGIWFLFGVNSTTTGTRILKSVRYSRDKARRAEDEDDDE
jgi:hypothetical protein